MSVPIEDSHIQMYANNYQLACQQKNSRFAMAATMDQATGEGARMLELVDPTSMEERVGNPGTTPSIKITQTGRWVYPRTYDWATQVANVTKFLAGIELTGVYVMNARAARNRRLDDTIITAMFADAKTGKTGSTTTSFDTANKQVAHGSVGLTVAKLIAAKQKLVIDDVDLDEEPIYCAIGAQQESNLLQQIQVTSKDYDLKAVITADGRVQSLLGINFIYSQRLAKTSTTRSCPLWTPKGVGYSIWTEEATISNRADMNNAAQPFASITLGATRLDEKRVVEVQCTEV